MNRVDLGYQARWETLKLIIRESRERADEGSELRATFDTVVQAMEMLEKAERPCLSRAIVLYQSPATGDRRAVYDPIPFLKELPNPPKALDQKEKP